MILPVELLTLICKSARLEDLKNIRLACSRLNAVVIPILFDRVMIAGREDVLRRFESRMVCSKYNEFIREMIVDCRLNVVQPGKSAHTVLGCLDFIYSALDEGDRCLDQWLQTGLRCLQSIHQLSFCYQSNWLLKSHRPSQSTARYDELYKSMWQRTVLGGQHRYNTLYTDAIFDALASASISPLRIVCYENGSQAVPGDMITMDTRSFDFRSEHTLKSARKVFHEAKVVRLSLRDTGVYAYHWPTSLSEYNPLMTGHLPRVLSAASNLEELSLTLYCYYGPPSPYKHPSHHPRMCYWDSGPLLEDHLLGTCTWPRLSTLKLYGCQFFSRDLTNLFDRHRSSLQKVELGYSRMRRSLSVTYCSWAEWLEDLRDTLGTRGLRKLDLNLVHVQDRGTAFQPSSPDKYNEEKFYTYYVSSRDLREFFESDGENPLKIGRDERQCVALEYQRTCIIDAET